MIRTLRPWQIATGRKSLLVVAFLLIVAGVDDILQSRQSYWVETSPSTSSVHQPSTLSAAKPSSKAVASYTVAPDLPKYLKIPSIGVNSRVFQVGLDRFGAVNAPSNVFDTAWYDGSAKPGRPGAVIIDGHISSWTSPGVFYRLTRLTAGEKIQIVRGDNAIFNYKVVKRVIYPSGNVDMQSVLAPVVAGRPGLNLISCTGDVIPGTSKFSERIVVFAEQLN